MTTLKYIKNYVNGNKKGKSFAAVMHNPNEVHIDYVRGSSPTNLRSEFTTHEDKVGSQWYATKVEFQ